MEEIIKYSVNHGVASIILNRPDKLNSFNYSLAMAFQKSLDDAQNDKEVRAVYLSGSGRAFSAGQDLAEAMDKNGQGLQEIVAKYYNPIIRKIRMLEKPVLCAVNGIAAGAGANIAFACDIVVAAKSAVFVQSFSKIGLVPDSGGTFFLPRLIGIHRASSMMFFGEKISAQQAFDFGLVYDIWNDDVFPEESLLMAEQLAKMPTKGIALTKKALNSSFDNTLDQQLDLEEQLQTLAGQSSDYLEGVNAFLEKRNPVFKGE